MIDENNTSVLSGTLKKIVFFTYFPQKEFLKIYIALLFIHARFLSGDHTWRAEDPVSIQAQPDSPNTAEGGYWPLASLGLGRTKS